MTENLRIPIETLDAALRAGEGCATPERIAAALAGELAEAERRALMAHAEGCAACAAEVALAREYFEAAASASEVEDVLARLPESPYAARPMAKVLPMRSRRPAAFRPATWAAAASVLLAVALGWVALRDRGPASLPDRPVTDVVRGGRIEITTSLGALSEAPATIAWREVAGAARYRVEILGVDGEPVAAAETTVPHWSVPSESRAALETFVAYRVRVVALDSAGAELAASPAAELRLEPAR